MNVIINLLKTDMCRALLGTVIGATLLPLAFTVWWMATLGETMGPMWTLGCSILGAGLGFSFWWSYHDLDDTIKEIREEYGDDHVVLEFLANI